MNKFAVIVFPDEEKADQGVSALRELHEQGSLSLFGLTRARKNADGELSMIEKKGEGVPGGAVGALAGGLVGLLGGPLTAVVGAAGGAWLGIWRDISHLGVGADFVEAVSQELAPGTAAVIADIAEDQVAPLDERMEALDGVVLREWQSELPEVELATAAAARKTELEHLEAELEQIDSGAAEVPEARRRLVSMRLEKARERLDEVGRRASEKLDTLRRRSDDRLATLERQAETAGTNARLSIERRIAEVRDDRDRREALLRQTMDIAGAGGQA